MANHRTAWHVLFVAGLSEHGPPGFNVLAELLLSTEPLRADVVIVRRREGLHDDAAARTLVRFWPLVRHTALMEFKSPSRFVREGEVAKLFGYGGQYHALNFEKLTTATDLLLVLVVPSLTPTLKAELRCLDLGPAQVAPGYWLAEGRPYALLVIDLTTVVEADRDELMAIFIRSKLLSAFATRFMERHRMTPNAPQPLAELEDYHDVVQRWLSSLTPAERLEGLSPEQKILALPDDILRGFAEDYLRTLPAAVQQAIRHRIGRPA